MATILHSIYGRKLGVDASGYVTGEKGAKWPQVYLGASGSEIAILGSTAVVAHTSATTGTDILAGGVTSITSAVTIWRMDAPVPGVPKWISRLSASTSTTGMIQLESGTFLSSLGTTCDRVALTGASAIALMGVTTALFAVVGLTPSSTSTPFVAFSTST